MRVLCTSLAVALFSGCGIISIDTNIPLFNGSGVTLVITNASDYNVAILEDGKLHEFNFDDEKQQYLKTGQTKSLHLTSWRSYKKVTITAKAFDCAGKFVGIRSKVISITSGYQESYPWEIRNQSFADNHWGNWDSWNDWGGDGHGH